MKTLQTLLKRARANPRIPVACLLVAALAGGLVVLNQRATQEADARKSAEVLQLEKNPQDWLAHQQNASHFRHALDARSLSLVGLANGQSGVVLYTLKTGEKASATVPGCSAKRSNDASTMPQNPPSPGFSRTQRLFLPWSCGTPPTIDATGTEEIS